MLSYTDIHKVVRTGIENNGIGYKYILRLFQLNNRLTKRHMGYSGAHYLNLISSWLEVKGHKCVPSHLTRQLEGETEVAK